MAAIAATRGSGPTGETAERLHHKPQVRPFQATPVSSDQTVANSGNTPKVGRMPMTVDQLVAESTQLPLDVRAELIERIVLSAHGGITPRIDEAWRQETRRRIAEIQGGQARAIPLDEALTQVRKHAGL